MWSLSIVIEKPLLPQIRHFLRLILHDMNIVTFIPTHPDFFFPEHHIHLARANRPPLGALGALAFSWTLF